MSEAATGLMSDGPIEHLKRGWALAPFVGRRVHYWAEDTDTMPPMIAEGGRVRYYMALCGVTNVTTSRFPMLGEGNWPRCKRCAQRVK